MDVLQQVLYGFQICLQPINLLYCFIGVFVGTLIGVLPGIGPIGTMAILFPITYHIDPIPAIIMLSGITYGGMYGGSTTSVLVNIPGESASVVTCLDGHQMALKGRAGAALGIAAFGSFIAGTLSLVGLMFFSIPLTNAALKFGAPENMAIMTFGLTLVIYMARGSMVKALSMAALGLMLSGIGLDMITGVTRHTLGFERLLDGIGLVPMMMGLFGISEILMNLETEEQKTILKTRIDHLFPNLQDWKDSINPILRGTVLGFFIGILPGTGPGLISFLSYAAEKRFSKEPEKFGTGAIAGVAGPESANNAAVSGGFVPLFTLGIPANSCMAILLGAMILHGFQPGPLILTDHPDLFWGVITSMYVGNVMLVLLNLPLIPLWVQVLKVPYRILFPLILLFCLIGVYSVNNNTFDILVMIVFGILGYLFRKLDFEPAPLIMTFILGPMWESAFRQSLLMSKGSFLIFMTRPISAVALIIAFVILFFPLFSSFWKKKGH